MKWRVISIIGNLLSFYVEGLLIFYFCLLTSFLIKIPVVPFHMWLPEAHAEAPTPGSIILSGLVLKVGGFGIYKYLLPIYGNFYYYLPLIYTLILVSIIYSILICLRINHIKQIIAYLSIVHMSFSILGFFINKFIGATGTVFSMLSHSLVSSGMFFLIGGLFAKYGSYYIEDCRGLHYNMPIFTFFIIILLFSTLAIPLTSGFNAELFILLDLVQFNYFVCFILFIYYIVQTGLITWLMNRLLFTDVAMHKVNKNVFIHYKDLSNAELVYSSIIIFLIFLLGVNPNIVNLNLLLI